MQKIYRTFNEGNTKQFLLNQKDEKAPRNMGVAYAQNADNGAKSNDMIIKQF